MVANNEGAAGNDSMEVDGSGSAERQEGSSYWCHLCARNVQTRLNAESDEVECEGCGGCFVEEVEDDTPGQERAQDFVPHEGTPQETSPASQERSDNVEEEPRRSIRITRSSLSRQGSAGNSDEYGTRLRTRGDRTRLNSPCRASDERRGRVDRLFTSRGQPVEVYITGAGGPGTAGLMGALGGMFQSGGNSGGTLGDYAFGNISNIINHLMQNDPNQDEVDNKHDCAVCKDVYELKEEALRLPCAHDFHSDCILPWLKQHNSCPVCRFELPTDDQEYESTRGGDATSTPANSTMAS
ncbi:hypothetical protein DYB37_011907 [Aphanomyces astaci]|uniref:RING-type domain-containing protein n=1 Tax=Aphanomyces astaci TaxID=112090 RepID=A0A397CKG5_APHAT|nr:hypothetical protein DYB25_007730 [Aphanomyces astaci]RHY47095.1 hypothetical protein DYB30_011715 [Aphanomyces astaci]RHY87090.1 hypothetical protein DYB26_014666 [Aphanomyces astaci]RHZ02248.1 hypothetical protein DYB35_013129 [Aphanomyces astaci]RHZ29577.1 hypothetical protein DYB37_011907 [Aphanomyces astaci]